MSGMYIICLSGEREKLQFAAMAASVAAVSGTDVHIFLSMNAFPYFVKGHSKEAPAEGKLGEVMAERKVPPVLPDFRAGGGTGRCQNLGLLHGYGCSRRQRGRHGGNRSRASGPDQIPE